jgi:uncharacterized protein YkwD
MVHKPISIRILPLFLALTGAPILAVLTAIPSNNNHAFAEENNNTGFGQPQQQQPPPTNNTGFGQPQQQQPPPTNNTGFGQPPPPTNTTGFGQQQPPTNNTGFGQQQPPTNTTGFGQEDSNTGFGQQPQQQPPTNTTGFGQQQPPTNNTGFGQQQQPPTNNTGFGQQQQPPTNNTGNTTQQSADFVKTILEIHNRERAAVSVAPLVWNDTLAAGAKAWAEHLATTGLRQHAPHVRENIAWGGRCSGYPGEPGYSCTPYTVIELQEGWVHEKVNCMGPFCNTCASQHECGHYTTMVGDMVGDNKQVGCGIASGPPSVIMGVLVCRYHY